MLAGGEVEVVEHGEDGQGEICSLEKADADARLGWAAGGVTLKQVSGEMAKGVHFILYLKVQYELDHTMQTVTVFN